MARCFLVIASGILLVSSTCAATLFHSNDFESGTLEDWSGASPTNQANGGPQGAGDNFLQLVSNGTVGPNSKMAAKTPPLPDPNTYPDWIGDYEAAGIEIVTVDMMVPISSPSLEMRLVLFGPTTESNRWTSTSSMAIPNDGIWRNYTFSVAEADLTFVPLTPSGATYDQLIADVRRVMLRHDPGVPSSQGVAIAATLGIDNARLTKSFPPGDFDMDDDVDGDDFLLWQRGGSPNPLSQGDLALWEANYPTSFVSATSVPEPATWMVLLIGMMALPRRRDVVAP